MQAWTDPLAGPVCGVVLAGGEGRRVGGVDKGLLKLNGEPLARLALERLRPQVDQWLISANRHLDVYAAWGAEVCVDSTSSDVGSRTDPHAGPQSQPHAASDADRYVGPLAGFLAAEARSRCDWLATVPCDVPTFPRDLVARLAQHAHQTQARLVQAAVVEDGRVRPQPVFSLWHRSLAPGLRDFVAAGGRKVGAWAESCGRSLLVFDAPDASSAFFNINTLDDLSRAPG
jgi:molybdopterin-guanine dinucleotide biosynthesis protein A